jgi:hypothetical protein
VDIGRRSSFILQGDRYTGQCRRNGRRPQWEQKGFKSIEEKASKEVTRILAGKREDCLTGMQLEKLDAIRKKWDGLLDA